jgi:hypothetical protein
MGHLLFLLAIIILRDRKKGFAGFRHGLKGLFVSGPPPIDFIILNSGVFSSITHKKLAMSGGRE